MQHSFTPYHQWSEQLWSKLELQVDNYSNISRIHLIVDVAEDAHERTMLKPGTVCDYAPHGVRC